jgi:hypothetical protein
MYIFMCYMPTKSLHNKSTCHMVCAKKIKFNAKNKIFHMTIFVFFYIDHKTYQLSAKF